jgi:hypothetical protein
MPRKRRTPDVCGSCKTGHTLVVLALLNVKDNVQYTPVHRSGNADPNDIRQERIREGMQMVMEWI